MNKSGTVAIQRMVDSKELPPAGPVRTYRLGEEFETKIARNLQTIIRIGKPQMVAEKEAREQAINEIIMACYKELNERGGQYD
jgi:hypothetical protein